MQAIPILHFFADKPEIFYAVIDEEKPTEKETKESKQDDKAIFTPHRILNTQLIAFIRVHSYSSTLPSSPHLELLTPPPNFC